MAAAVLLASLAATGCEVTPDKIQRWKETEKGPGRLRDAVRSGSLGPELRAQALAALVELGMVTEAQEDLKQSPEAERRAVLHAAIPSLVALAQGSSRGAQRVDSTTRVQREGKDALFALRELAAPEDRAAADDALVAWTTADLVGRMTAGAHATDKIIAAVGSRAGPRLALVAGDEQTSEANRLEAARLLGKVGDRAAREQAGAALVERARRQRRVQEATLQEIGLIGGDHAVAYLSALAEDGHQSAEVRTKALYALGQGGDPAALPSALRIAGDGRADGNVRDAAFELAEKIGPTAVPGLARFLGDKDEAVRWRAVRATLDAGKAQAIATVLESLPPRPYSEEDLRSYLIHELVLIGPSGLPALRDELRSRSWVARLGAAVAIGELGHADDAARVETLTGDGTRLKGWPGAATVGLEARALAASLRLKK